MSWSATTRNTPMKTFIDNCIEHVLTAFIPIYLVVTIGMVVIYFIRYL